MDKELLSVKEIEKKPGISLITLSDWVKRGLQSLKRRGQVYFPHSDVIDHVKKNRSHQLIPVPVLKKFNTI